MCSALHLAAEMFRAKAGINLVHVPYKGSGPAMAALLGGELRVVRCAPEYQFAMHTVKFWQNSNSPRTGTVTLRFTAAKSQ